MHVLRRDHHEWRLALDAALAASDSPSAVAARAAILADVEQIRAQILPYYPQLAATLTSADLIGADRRLGWMACEWMSVLQAQTLTAARTAWDIIDLVRSGRLDRHPGREHAWSLTTASVIAHLER